MNRLGIFTVITVAACASPTAPIDQVSFQVAVDPTTVALGDSVTFEVRATNPTSDTIALGIECGPAADVRVRTPVGRRISAVRGDAPWTLFTCELLPTHRAAPGVSSILRVSWVPTETGRHTAWAVERRRPESTTGTAVTFDVR